MIDFTEARRLLANLDCSCADTTSWESVAWLKNFVDTAEERYYTSVKWSVDDFEGQAHVRKGKDWEEYYDKTKFKRALERMINQHDPNYGITWDTVDYYLEELCIKEED